MIAVQPSSQTVLAGSTAVFTSAAVGVAPLYYQWQKDGTNLADGGTFSGAATPVLTISNAQPTEAGGYSLLVTNPFGPVLSASASLAVAVLPTITTQPVPQAVAAGTVVNFSVTADGTAPLGYQWRKDGTNLADADKFTGVTTPSLTISNVQAADQGNYSVVVTNPVGSAVSSNSLLTVLLPPSISVQPANQTVSAAALAIFTVTAAGTAPLSFQWQKDGTNLVTGGKFSGATLLSLAVSNVQAAETGLYSVVVSNAYGQVVSSNALLRLWPLVSWGHNVYGQADVPAGLTDVVGVAGGHYHSLALKGNGTVAAWGAGTTYTKTPPHYGQSAVPAGLSNVLAVAAGYYHSLALRAGGTVVAWGASTNALGTSPNYGQALVPAALSNVVAVAGGAYHSLALKADGTLAAWGAGTANTGLNPDYGQSLVPPGLSNVLAIAGGAYHSLALKADTTVAAWGAGMINTGLNPDYGQSRVPLGLSNVLAIVAGGYHGLALKSDGTVVGWGAGMTNTGTTPDFGQSQVPAGLSNVVAIGAGAYHSVALLADGSLVVWGANTYGQANVPSTLSNVIAVGARGSYHVLALEGDGRPHVTVQPVSRAVPVGATVSFTALAVGAPPLSYQWQCNGTNLTDDARISGSRSTTLTVANALAVCSGNYALVVSNAYGSAVSSPATLSVPVVVPTMSWATPAPITYGTALGSNELNATASVPGVFVYAPPSGTVLDAGTNLLIATFDPTDPVSYASVTGSVLVVVWPVPLSVAANDATRYYGVTNPAFTGLLTGVVNDDNITASYSCSATSTSPVGPYAIVPALLDPDNRLANYHVTASNGTLTVIAPPPVFQLPAPPESNGLLSFTWSAAPGQGYQVQYRNDLTETGWLDLGDPITATSDVVNASDTATNAQRFYRVILVP